MGVCRRIFKNYQPTELTICVTICCGSQDPNRRHRKVGKKVPKSLSASQLVSEDVTDFHDVKKQEDPSAPITPNLNFKKFDLLSNDDVALELVKSKSIEDMGKKKMLVRRKKKSKTPEDVPRYREFTETTINMYVEMDKRNVGEFVWDQQCTRIDALVAPIVELDRTNTPEVPVDIDIFD